MSYNVMIDEDAGFAFFDAILWRWKEKRFPFNHPKVVVPQTLVPARLRADKKALACFLFFICIYMRGGIESAQAFKAMLKLQKEKPALFDPHEAQWEEPESISEILRKYVGWDADTAGYAWVENSRRLMRHWKGDPLLLFKGVKTYEEADRRIRNKRTKREQKKVGSDGFGFYGFQEKMVSMLIYFFDWEGWLEERFIYPTPADFHNFRLGLNQGIIELDVIVDDVRNTDRISKPWRELTMRYMEDRKADPVELADAIWLFSFWLCGRSPLNVTPKKPPQGEVISFKEHQQRTEAERQQLLMGKNLSLLRQTCLRCPFLDTCGLSIPAGPYYGRRKQGYKGGMLMLRHRYRIEDMLGRYDPDDWTGMPPLQHVLDLAMEPDGA